MAAGDKFIRAADVKPEPVRWLWDGRIPAGALTVIAGRPGQGKSLLSAYLAAKASQKGNVIFSSLEDAPAQVLRPRLEAAGANLRRIIFWTPRLPHGTDELEAAIRELKAKMVVLDPVAAHFNRSAEVDDRNNLTPLTGVLERTGCALVAIHHMLKSFPKNGHPLEAVGGTSGGLAACARAVYVFGPNPACDDERVLACAKGNWGKLPKATVFEVDGSEFYIARKVLETASLELVTDQADISASAVCQTARGSMDATAGTVSKKARACEWLTNYLSLGPRPAAEIREDAIQYGISWATVRRACDGLKVDKQRHGFGKGSKITWGLPAGHAGLLPQLPGSDEGDDDE